MRSLILGIAMLARSLAIFLALAFAQTAPAFAARIELGLSGTSFDGGPAFELSLGDHAVGAGVVDPLPTAGKARTFTFEVPDKLLAGNPTMTLRLTNDAFGGKGKDRNLYLVSAKIDGHDVPLDKFQLLSKGVPVAHRLRSGHLEIWSSQEAAVAAAPSAGWLLLVRASHPAITEVAGGDHCDAEVAVLNINSISAPLTAGQMASLAPLIMQAKSGHCAITINGYASVSGSASDNQRVSEARAQLVMKALQAAGANFSSATVRGLGPTSQFGQDEGPNHRAVARLKDAQG